LIVCDTGKAEPMLADARTDENINEHRQIDSQAELDRAMGDLLAWTSAGQE
jgi:hypothetical protein